MAINAISDSGPLIHLTEVGTIPVLKIFSPVAIGRIVESELRKNKIQKPKFVSTVSSTAKTKDFTEMLVLQYEIDLGEAESMGLVRQENANLFFTDDLDAREVAKVLDINVHGSIGILLRAFREKKLGKDETISTLQKLPNTSFFVTSELIESAVDAVMNFKR